MREIPKAYELYRHFKGNLYQILTIATDSEDGSLKVVYQALYGEYKVYVRPLDSFMSETDFVKYPDAKQKYRFEKLQDLETHEQCVEGEVTEKPEHKEEVSEAITIDAEKEQESSDMDGLDPAVVAYLDARGYEERLNILTGVHHRITEEMLTTMAVVSDIELEEGSVEEKYQSLKHCLLTKQKFEIVRHS